LWVFVRQYAYAQLLRQKSRTVTESHWFGPDLITVETDFQAIRAEQEKLSQNLYNNLERVSLTSGKQAFDNLVIMRAEMDQYSNDFREMQRAASHKTMANVERSVSRAQTGLQVATTVRDLSATTLVVGAAFLSGGAALATLGAGSTLKGTARYQESGNVGSAILEASGTFVVGMIGMAASLGEAGQAVRMSSRVIAPVGSSSAQRMTLVIVGAQIDSTYEGMKSAIEGGSAREAIARAGMRFATDIGSGLLGIRLDRAALPVIARLITDIPTAVGSDLLGNAAARQVRPPEVEPHVVPIRDCNPANQGACTHQEYVQGLVLRRR
jgi:hypothetical protein